MNRNERFGEMVNKNEVNPPDILTDLADKLRPWSDYDRPARCRAIIFDPSGNSILGIKRVRPDRDPYIVYPGGGLEENDTSPVDGIWRELDEELGLNYDTIILSEKVIINGDEMFFLGHAKTDELGDLRIGGPEAERDVSVSGTYIPGWFPIDSLGQARAFPEDITDLIIAQHSGETSRNA